MKKQIGKMAGIVAIIDLFIYIILLVSGMAFRLYPLTALAIVVWFVSLVVTAYCLLGDFIKFIGSQFSQGYNSGYSQNGATVFCKNCGKQVGADMAFCPHCGEKN